MCKYATAGSLTRAFSNLKMSLSLFPTQHEPEMGLCFQMVDEPENVDRDGTRFAGISPFGLIDKSLFPI